MLKSAIVQFERQDMIMSLVPWGPIRRWRVRRRGLDIAFVPKYELAVFLGTPVLRDALIVQSHVVLDRIDCEAFGLSCPDFADVFIGRQALESCKSFREVVGHQEGMEMLFQMIG